MGVIVPFIKVLDRAAAAERESVTTVHLLAMRAAISGPTPPYLLGAPFTFWSGTLGQKSRLIVARGFLLFSSKFGVNDMSTCRL